MYTGGGEGARGRGRTPPPQANFKTLVNTNAKKRNRGTSWQLFLKALTPQGILAKTLATPLTWIFNPCASMKKVNIK